VIERVLTCIIGGIVAAIVLAAVLPKLIPGVAAVFLMGIIGRWVWWYTR
jgi:hypothetical protein